MTRLRCEGDGRSLMTGKVTWRPGVGLVLGALVWIAVGGVPPAVAEGIREYAYVPAPGADHTAHRIDCDVFGWNRDFTEMAVLVSEVERGPGGKQRGEISVVVYRIDSIIPVRNVHVLYVTQADMPHDPLPIADIREKMWTIGDGFEHLWDRRPKRRQFPGAMVVDAVFDPVEVSPGVCRAAVGFMLTWRGRLRYQPHEVLRFDMPCSPLHHTDTRIYWAKRDLAAAMVRVDYGENEKNEYSTRMPLPVVWARAHTPKLLLRSGWPKGHKEIRLLVEKLYRFGDVEVEYVAALRQARPRVDWGKDFSFIAQRIAKDISGVVGGPMSAGMDAVISAGPSPRDGEGSAPETEARQAIPRSVEATVIQGVEDDAQPGHFLRGWSVP